MNGEKEKEKFFVKEEFIEWWAEAFAEALKRHTAKIEWLQRREIKLDEAKNAWPVDMIPPEGFDSGNYIKVLSLDGAATMNLDTLGSHEFDLMKFTEFNQLFHQVLITNAAQPGKKLVLALGKGEFSFPEAPEKRERLANFGRNDTKRGFTEDAWSDDIVFDEKVSRIDIWCFNNAMCFKRANGLGIYDDDIELEAGQTYSFDCVTSKMTVKSRDLGYSAKYQIIGWW